MMRSCVQLSGRESLPNNPMFFLFFHLPQQHTPHTEFMSVLFVFRLTKLWLAQQQQAENSKSLIISGSCLARLVGARENQSLDLFLFLLKRNKTAKARNSAATDLTSDKS